jgi:DNA mismatch repair protein MutS2
VLTGFQDQIYALVEREMQADSMPISIYEPIAEDLYLLSKIDYVLTLEAIIRIRASIQIAEKLYHYFSGERMERLNALKQFSKFFDLQGLSSKIIDKVLDETGEMKANASPKLAELSKSIEKQKALISKEFIKLIRTYKSRDLLADNVESYRNGRRVLVVPAEKKRMIKGVILDESATGKTAFIEPESIFGMNNEIFHLEAEKREEIFRILKALCAELHPFKEVIGVAHKNIVHLDAIQAKAKFAQLIKANKPTVNSSAKLWMKQAKNPILYLKYLGTPKHVIPFDLCLDPPNRILLVSGPNAGGKSVLMKTVVLIQMMFQKGFPISVAEGSEMGIFSHLFGDLGDQQSIEDDLSTYSSKLKNLKYFLDNAGPESLLIIDEFGSGTDPKLGGAIAEAVLRELNYKKVSGVVTTHYSNLKMFAYKNRGIVNGAMIFDTSKFKPSYELKIGRPGSSFAFEIAQNAGFSTKILDYAKNRAGKANKAVDELLVDLQTEKKDIEDKQEALSNREKELDRMSKAFDQLKSEMDFKRQKQKFEEKQRKLVDIDQQNKSFERLIRELKEEKNIEKAKKIAKSVRESKKLIKHELEVKKEELVNSSQTNFEFKVGDSVKLKVGSESGTIISIQKDKVDIVMGHMQMRVSIQELQPAREAIDIKKKKSINTGTLSTWNEEDSMKLDIRGMVQYEALSMVEQFLDNALLTNRAMVRIIHGKGSGALKKLVRQKTKEYEMIQEIYHPADENGGDGVTIIKF